MKILPARSKHAQAICETVRRSIRDLCVSDHKNDPVLLDAWLDGKTPERVRQWLLNRANDMIIAKLDGQIVGAGCARGSEVILNYVLPEARFRGVSKALLMALEDRIRERGGERVTLESTTTALQFYQSRGYRQRAEQTHKFGIVTWPLMKEL